MVLRSSGVVCPGFSGRPTQSVWNVPITPISVWVFIFQFISRFVCLQIPFSFIKKILKKTRFWRGGDFQLFVIKVHSSSCGPLIQGENGEEFKITNYQSNLRLNEKINIEKYQIHWIYGATIVKSTVTSLSVAYFSSFLVGKNFWLLGHGNKSPVFQCSFGGYDKETMRFDDDDDCVFVEIHSAIRSNYESEDHTVHHLDSEGQPRLQYYFIIIITLLILIILQKLFRFQKKSNS